jgi:hypothetical protein
VDVLIAKQVEIERQLHDARSAHAASADKLSKLKGDYNCAAASQK